MSCSIWLALSGVALPIEATQGRLCPERSAIGSRTAATQRQSRGCAYRRPRCRRERPAHLGASLAVRREFLGHCITSRGAGEGASVTIAMCRCHRLSRCRHAGMARRRQHHRWAGVPSHRQRRQSNHSKSVEKIFPQDLMADCPQAVA
jgi:hypothetical protein